MLKTACGRITALLNKREWLVFLLGFLYALYWQAITPIQYTGDSNSYYNLAKMLVGGSSYGMPMIFRPIGYPLLLAITGVPFGTFKVIMLVQALFAAAIPLFIYRIIAPYGTRSAMAAAIFAIMTGVTVVHSSQIMTEQLFMFLLFLGLAIVVSLIRNPGTSSKNIYWFAFVFAALNTVRPIAGPMFWLMLLIICVVWWRERLLKKLWKKPIGAASLFIALMSVWVVADDIIFSTGVRYSPSNLQKIGADSKVETYLYDLPFNEAYYDVWKRRIQNPEIDPETFGTLADRPAMAKIREVVRTYLTSHTYQMVAKNSQYSSPELFGKFRNDSDELVNQMFANPNYVYANYIRSALEMSLSVEDRLKLFDEAAKEAGKNVPARWLNQSPAKLFLGPSRGNGAMKFALAFGPLRGYACSLTEPTSLIRPENGPASQLLFKTFAEILRNHPEFWQGYTDGSYKPFFGNPDAMIQQMLIKPSYNYTWFITVMLWQTMGYDSASELMGKAADEAFAKNSEELAVRVWNTFLVVVAGPGEVQFDTSKSNFARIDSYAYMQAPELTKNHVAELQETKDRYEQVYLTWQDPTKTIFMWFYFTKPLFLITSLMAIAILWARGKAIIVPILLMIPYGASMAIYGALVTALPRYTNPTILIPVMVTFMALPTVVQIVRERTRRVLPEDLAN